MKILNYESVFGDELAFSIMKLLEKSTEELRCVLPRGWRAGVIIKREGNEWETNTELFNLDIQSDRGGGSWTQAKLETLQGMEIAATYPMQPAEISELLSKRGLANEKYAKEIAKANHFEDLSPEAIKWLVDVKNGPGIAPNYGGICVPYECHYLGDYLDKIKMFREKGEIYIAFSGAKALQDLQFAVEILRLIQGYYFNKKNECLSINVSPLRNYPDIEFWLKNLGVE